MLPTSEIMHYRDISPRSLKESHSSGLVMTIRLQGLSAMLLKLWIAVREHLQLSLCRNGSAFSMIFDHMIMSACELTMRILFPKLRYVTGYISHFDASCSFEREQGRVDFSILALSR